MSHTAPQDNSKTVSEVRIMSVSFVGKLDDGELLDGTPTVAEVDTSDLTISNEVVNTAALVINGYPVAIGEAVQFKVVGGVAGQEYSIRIYCATDSSPAQTLYGIVTLTVEAD